MTSQTLMITVNGQIKECITCRSKDLYCKYGYSFGSDWSIALGESDGTSQTSKLSKDNRCVWNHPINVAFKSSKPCGWPQIILSVYGHNHFGNDMVVGYAAIHIPTTPGHHELKAPLFVPASSSHMQSIIGFFTGLSPEFINMNFISGGQNREVAKTNSQGYVSISFDVLMRGLDTLNLIAQADEL